MIPMSSVSVKDDDNFITNMNDLYICNCNGPLEKAVLRAQVIQRTFIAPMSHRMRIE